MKPTPPISAPAPAQSLADVAAFVQKCNADRLNSAAPFENPQPQEESGFVFTEFHENSPLPLAPDEIEKLAEEWQHRRKVFPKESIHD